MGNGNIFGSVKLFGSDSNAGLRFYRAYSAWVAGTAKYVALMPPATDPPADVIIKLLKDLPAAGLTEALTINSNGDMGRQALGGGGTVTAVSSGNTSLLTISNANTTPQINWAGHTAYEVFCVGPTNGAPDFMLLTAAHIPALTAAKISDFDTQVRINRLDQMALPTASVNLNSQKAIGVLDPTNPQDAATKSYVDALISTGTNKGTARAATTGAITLSNPGTNIIDAVSLVVGDLVLVKNQATASQNGLYVFQGSAAAMTRATNADTSAEVRAGMYVFISEGTTNGNTGWTLTTDDPITLGTSNLVYTQTTGSGAGVVDGAGMTLTGNRLDVVGTANRITVNADSIDIASNYAGQTSIVTLGTVTTGTWQGTLIAVAFGGTGANTAAGARTNLEVPQIKRGTFTSANLVSSQLTINHGMNLPSPHFSCDVIIVNPSRIPLGAPDNITFTDANNVTVDMTSFNTPTPITGTWGWLAKG